MRVTLRDWSRAETDELVSFLTGDDWPFHTGGRPVASVVREQVAAGRYDGAGVRTFWVVADGVPAGLLRLADLEDDTPVLDLRVAAEMRGRGIGTAVLDRVADLVFEQFPHVHRIEATTRRDNVAMRGALRRAGWVQEAHYRDAWPDAGGRRHDAAGYAVLRRDWTLGTVTPVDRDDVG